MDKVFLPPEKGSTLNGALDNAFYAVACRKRKERCPCSSTCPYAVIFKAEGVKREKYKNLPKAYLIEPPFERKTIFQPGEILSFRLLLFGKGIRYFPWFIIALQALEQFGIGRGRGRVELVEIHSIHPLSGIRKPIYLRDSETGLLPNESLLVHEDDIIQSTQKFSGSEVILEFLTPTRIKMKGSWLSKPTFAQLMVAILRRSELLSRFYGQGVSGASLKELLKYTESIELKQDHLAWYDWERYSRRQQEKMTLGGIVGRIIYVGKDLSRFMPYLLLGQLIHIGKGYVYGMGKYVVLDSNGEIIWDT